MCKCSTTYVFFEKKESYSTFNEKVDEIKAIISQWIGAIPYSGN
jgi:hypothetical protein